MNELLTTAVVGSYPQPEWLIDREQLGKRPPPRAQAKELWRVDAEYLEAAKDDATRLAIHDMERAGIEIISDGEARRESYSNWFVNELGGVDVENPGSFVERSGVENAAPRIVGQIRHQRPLGVRDVEFLRANTDRRIKVTLPGPFTMTQQAQNDYYEEDVSLARDLAATVREEVELLFAAGADIVQLDEPYLQAQPERAQEYGIDVVNRALTNVSGTTALHICFGYGHFIKDKPAAYAFFEQLNDAGVEIVSLEAAQPNLDPSFLSAISNKRLMVGVVDGDATWVESPDLVETRIRAALEFVEPSRLMPAPDCGMKYLTRDVAFAKLQALADGTAHVKTDLSA